MDLKAVLTEVQSWPAEDRLRWIEDVRDGLSDAGADPGISRESKDLLDGRPAALDSDPGDVLTRDEIAAYARRPRWGVKEIQAGMIEEEPPIVTKSGLIEGLEALGVGPGRIVMLHASVRAVGWVVGGPDVVLRALRDVLGPDGTLMMMVGWEDNPYDMDSWPEARRRAYLEECPPFDPATSRANRRWSILAEYLRTTPGARRSANPEKSMAAIGAEAERLTADHPLDHGFGPGSPLEKLCRAGGQVLLLGTPFESVTLLHYAECLAEVPGKRVVRYRMPILSGGLRRWAEVEEFDTCDGIRAWGGGDYFFALVGDYLATGQGRMGRVGAARSYLFDARELVTFGVAWLEREFG